MATRANALAVMAKAPVAGQVKTRLLPFLSPVHAASLYASLLVDLLTNLRSFGAVDRYLAYAPVGAEDSLRKLAPTEFNFLAQRGQDLGERMRNVFQDLFDANYRGVVLIGSDLPVFSLEFLTRAFALLDESDTDLVLGPNRDGGYYLIGMQRLVPEVFDGVVWGSDSVFEATCNKIEALGLNVSLLPPWVDVDTPADVAALLGHIDQLDPQRQRQTLRWLNDWRAGRTPAPPSPMSRNSGQSF
jgi:rSAM/selenodomain-associated transferase 1